MASVVGFASENQQGFFGVESMAIDAKSPNIVYLSAGISYFNNGKSYILRSADYGATFTSVDVTAQFKVNGNGNGRGNGERLQVDPLTVPFYIAARVQTACFRVLILVQTGLK